MANRTSLLPMNRPNGQTMDEKEEIDAKARRDASTALYGPQSKLYRDNVWTEIRLSTLAARIISTPEFQRLDMIKQLGFSDRVYRGAKHTRFLHSVGTYHVAKRLASQVWENHTRFGLAPPGPSMNDWVEIVEIIGLAGLLHDITHIPNGHALEDEHQGLYDKHDSLESPRLWYLLFDPSSHIAQLFESGEPYFAKFSNLEARDLIYLILKFRATIKPQTDEVSSPAFVSFPDELAQARQRLSGTNSLVVDKVTAAKSLNHLGQIHTRLELSQTFEPFMSDIVGNTICADLIDYLARDSAGTGLRFQYDERIEHYLTIQKESLTGQRRLVLKLSTEKGFKLDTSSTMTDLIGMRYSLAEKVYYHKTKVAADVMLGALLSIVQPPSDRRPFGDARDGVSGGCFLPDEVLSMGDEDLLDYCRRRIESMKKNGDIAKAEAAQDLLSAIRERRLFKPCIIVPHNIAEATNVRVAQGEGHETRSLYRVLYDRFRQNPEVVRAVESQIDGLFGDGKRHAMIFCPAHKPQAKQARTIVEALLGEVKPLDVLQKDGNSPLPSPMKIRLDAINQMYGELWKFFVFIRWEDFSNPVLRHGIAIAFWEALRRMGIQIDSGITQRVSYPPLSSPAVLVESWLPGVAHWADKKIVAKLEALAGENEAWASLAVELGMEADDHHTFLDLCYVRNLIDFYEAEGVTDLSGIPAGKILSTLKSSERGLVLHRTASGDQQPREERLPHWGVLFAAGFVGGRD